MKITFDKTPEQVALIKNMAAKDKTISEPARESFAAAITPVIQEVILNASTLQGIYRDVPFDQNTEASIPFDTYFDEAAGLFTIWSQNTAGGLPSNFTHSVAELKVQTYTLETAVSFSKKYAAQSRLDVIAKAMTRMANEVQIKQDVNGWLVILKALANATTKSQQHVFRVSTAGLLQPEDFNKLKTRAKRINASYDNGTPDSTSARGVTDLYLSPEAMEQIRAMAYQPVNTRSGAVTASGASSIAAPDSFRSGLFNGGGITSFFDVVLHELNELGKGYKYNTVFDNMAGATTYTTAAGSGSAAFDGAATEIVVGFDASRDALFRPVEINEDSQGQLVVMPDDQFPARSEKFGFYAKVTEGRVIADARAIQGLIL